MSTSRLPTARQRREEDTTSSTSAKLNPASSLFSPAARVLPHNFMISFAESITVASQLSLIRNIACKAHWLKIDPTNLPLPDSELCDVPEVAALISSIIAGMAVLSAVLGLGLSAYVQRLADRLGRKPVLVALTLFDLVATVVLVLGFTSSNIQVSYILIFLANVLSSVSQKTSFIQNLVIADTATVEQRAPWFARLAGVGLCASGVAYISSSALARLFSSEFVAYAVAATLHGLASLWALFVIPETRIWELQAEVEAVEEEQEQRAGDWTKVGTAILSPLKPLRLLWPGMRTDGGGRAWNLLLLGTTGVIANTGTSFTTSAIILYLQDHYHFTASENGFVMAYLLGSRFVFLTILFPVILKFGRRAFHQWQLSHPLHVPSSSLENGVVPLSETDERTPLLHESAPPGEVLVVESSIGLSNHFDVIAVFFSLQFDALGYAGVYFTTAWQQVIGCFTVLSFGGGLGSSLTSAFLASVEPAHASESMAALSILSNIAYILSPVVMGSLYSVLLKAGKGEVLFAWASVMCVVASAFVFFVRRN